MDSNSTLVIAIGSKAQDIVNLSYKDNSDINFLCLDYEKQIINTSEAKTIWYNNLEFQKDKYDFEEYKNILLNRTSKFNEIITKYEKLIIVSFAGENYSSDTLFEVIKYIENLKIEHKIFIICPFDFEGKKACDLAIMTLGRLTKLKYSLGNNLFIFENDNISEENSENQARTLSNKKASEVLSMILELNNI